MRRMKPDSKLNLEDILTLLTVELMDDLRADGEVVGGFQASDAMHAQALRISELLQLTKQGLVETLRRLQAVAASEGSPYKPTPKSGVQVPL